MYDQCTQTLSLLLWWRENSKLKYSDGVKLRNIDSVFLSLSVSVLNSLFIRVLTRVFVFANHTLIIAKWVYDIFSLEYLYSFRALLTRYQNILWGGSFGHGNLLNFTFLDMKFYKFHHATRDNLGKCQYLFVNFSVFF